MLKNTLYNSYKIALTSLMSNRKSVFLTTIGLTIALSISFQMILFIIGSKGALLESFMTGNYSYGLFGGALGEQPLDIQIGPDFEMGFFNTKKTSEELNSFIQEDVQSIASRNGFGKTIRNIRLVTQNEIELYYRTSSSSQYIIRTANLIGVPNDQLEFINDYLTSLNIPLLNENNSVMLIFNKYTHQAIYPELTYRIGMYGALNDCNVTLVEFPIEVKKLDEFTPVIKQLKRNYGSLIDSDQVMIITSLDGLNKIYTKMELVDDINIHRHFVFCDFEYSRLSILSKKSDIQNFNNLQNSLRRSFFYSFSSTPSYVYSRIVWNYELFYEDFAIIQAIIFTLTIPPISIGFFMINFSYQLIRKQNIHHINLLKTRGATSNQIFLCLSIETLLSSTIAIILGASIGVPLILLIGKTSGFLEFKSEIPIAEYSFSIASVFILIVIVVGILLSLIINIPRIHRLSKLEASNLAIEEERKRDPFWKLFHLDKILSILAFISLAMFLYIVNTILPIETKTILILVFGSTTPILIVSAIGFIIARYLTNTIRKIGDAIWKKRSGTFALSIKNLSHHHKQTSRAIILICITLTFGIVSAIVPATIDYNTYQRSIYVFGADIVLTNFPNTEYFRQNVLGIENVEAVTVVVTQSTKFADIFIGTSYIPSASSLLGIEPNSFLQTAFIRPNAFGFSDDINNLVAQLNNEGNILTQKQNARDFNMPIGSTHDSYGRSYKVTGTFQFFPRVYSEKKFEETKYIQYIVGSIETVSQLLNDWSISMKYFLYIKQSQPGVSHQIIQSIKSSYSNIVAVSSEQDAENNLQMPARISIYAMLNSSFITTTISTIACLAIYSFLILFDRSKDLSIIRALGAKTREIFSSFVWESLLLLLIALFIGVPLGIGVSFIISNVINSYLDIPPLVIDVPWIALVVILGLFIIFTITISLIPAFYASKREINDLSRAT